MLELRRAVTLPTGVLCHVWLEHQGQKDTNTKQSRHGLSLPGGVAVVVVVVVASIVVVGVVGGGVVRGVVLLLSLFLVLLSLLMFLVLLLNVVRLVRLVLCLLLLVPGFPAAFPGTHEFGGPKMRCAVGIRGPIMSRMFGA